MLYGRYSLILALFLCEAGSLSHRLPLHRKVKRTGGADFDPKIPSANGVPTPIDRSGWTINASSHQPGFEPEYVFDCGGDTWWESESSPDVKPLPHSITIDMKNSLIINQFAYLPRQDGCDCGNIARHTIETSLNGESWRTVAKGTYSADAEEKLTSFESVPARYIRLTAETEVSGNQFVTAAEINILSAPDPILPRDQWSVSADSEISSPSGHTAIRAIDGSSMTFWKTDSPSDSASEFPHYITIDQGDVVFVSGLSYLPPPEESGPDGRIGNYVIQTSDDGETFTEITRGTWADNCEPKYSQFSTVSSRWVRLVAQSEAGGRGPQTSAAEINLLDGSREYSDFAILASSEEPTVSWQDGRAVNAQDDDTQSIWHTRWNLDNPPSHPHYFTIDLQTNFDVHGLNYTPRQEEGMLNGNIGEHRIEISLDNQTWTEVATGSWKDDHTPKIDEWDSTTARYVRLTALSEAGGRGPWASAAEIRPMLNEPTSPPPPKEGELGDESQPSPNTSASRPTPNMEGLQDESQFSTDTSDSTVPPDKGPLGDQSQPILDASESTMTPDEGPSGDESQPSSNTSPSPLPSSQTEAGDETRPSSTMPTSPLPSSQSKSGDKPPPSSTMSTSPLPSSQSKSGDKPPPSSKLSNSPLPSSQTTLGDKTRPSSTISTSPLPSKQTGSEDGTYPLLKKLSNPLPSNKGKWGNVIDFPLVPVLASIVPGTNKVIVWSSSGPDSFGGPNDQTLTATYDPKTGAVTQETVTITHHDMFCPGVSLSTNAAIIVSGGDNNQATSSYLDGKWTSVAKLNTPRGYNAQVTLSSGDLFTIGGSWTGPKVPKDGEIYNPKRNKWDRLTGCVVKPMLTGDKEGVYRADNHGWLFGREDQTVFQAGPSKAMNWYSTAGKGSTHSAGTRGDDQDAMNGNAAMYDAPAGKILTIGGSKNYNGIPATSNAHIITLGAALEKPSVERIGNMKYARAFANSVILPTGHVVVVGGVTFARIFTDDTAVLYPELFDPDRNTFTTMAPMTVPRTYHSTCILMMDATVFCGGGGLCSKTCKVNHLDAQVFTPPYLLDAKSKPVPRPQIVKTNPANSVAIGKKITVQTREEVGGFTLMRAGSATHSINTDQRRVPLKTRRTDNDGDGVSYIVYIPADTGVMIPGAWMLFAISEDGVPSHGTVMEVDAT